MIVIASDHAGFMLKEHLKKHLMASGIGVLDVGTDSTAACDYPDLAWEAAQRVLSGECESGILVCGTGIGMSIAANKIKGIRAAVCGDTYSARMARAHNNANILCIGERVVGNGLACDLVSIFLSTAFENTENHTQRVGLIDDIDQGRR